MDAAHGDLHGLAQQPGLPGAVEGPEGPAAEGNRCATVTFKCNGERNGRSLSRAPPLRGVGH